MSQSLTEGIQNLDWLTQALQENESAQAILYRSRSQTNHKSRVWCGTLVCAAATPVPTNDIWIAASAMQHGLAVLTMDAHFQKIPQILAYHVPS